MAAPFFSTPVQPYVYQSPQDAVIAFQILGGEAQIVQVMLKPQEKVISKSGKKGFLGFSLIGVVLAGVRLKLTLIG